MASAPGGANRFVNSDGSATRDFAKVSEDTLCPIDVPASSIGTMLQILQLVAEEMMLLQAPSSDSGLTTLARVEQRVEVEPLSN